jgi:hypothetical protein
MTLSEYRQFGCIPGISVLRIRHHIPPRIQCVGNHVPSHGNHHVIESLAVLGLQSVSDLCRAGDHEPNVIERNHAMRPRVGGVLTP